VGAHYDSCFNPGADDNASGVAGVLWLAKALKNADIKSNILFVAFTNEEPPLFKTEKMGSRVFVKDAHARGVKVTRAVVLEMIGFYSDQMFSQRYLPLMGPFYPSRGDFIAIVGNFRSRTLASDVNHAFVLDKRITSATILSPGGVPGISFSDHASFWEAGIPAVMITDTAYLRNGHYHQQGDTVDTLDYLKMAAVVEGVKDAILLWSER
jgi:Zn-dependent M28 family amino/carboxypeptidase